MWVRWQNGDGDKTDGITDRLWDASDVRFIDRDGDLIKVSACAGPVAIARFEDEAEAAMVMDAIAERLSFEDGSVFDVTAFLDDKRMQEGDD